MGLLLLKLRAVELETRTESRRLIANWYYILGETVQDMLLVMYLRQIASSQVTTF